MVERARGGLGAGEGLDGREGGGCGGVGDSLGGLDGGVSWVRARRSGFGGGGMRKVGVRSRGRELEEGRTVSRPREMVPTNLQMVAVVRDILCDAQTCT